jgi:hypothetical protein
VDEFLGYDNTNNVKKLPHLYGPTLIHQTQPLFYNVNVIVLIISSVTSDRPIA